MRIVLAALGLLAVLLLTPADAGARTEGPFTARIVDSATGQPIAGVVVVALYQKKTPGGPHPDVQFYDLDETVSDGDGRVVLPRRELPMSTPLLHVAGPTLIVFKPGYGIWHFQGVDLGPGVDTFVRQQQVEASWRRLRGAGAVIELKSSPTREQRARAHTRAHMFPPIPEDRAPHLRKALEDDRLATEKYR